MEWREMGGGYCVRVLRDEELIEQLTAFAAERGIKAGSISGIGAVKDVELGFYELETKTYHRKVFAEDHELVSLVGNVSLVDGQPFIHAHVTIGAPDYTIYGGHLFKANIAVTGEFIVRPLEGEVHRALDEGCGLNLWSLG